MSINLLYHDVTPTDQEDASGFSGAGAARYKLTPTEFREHTSRIASAVAKPPYSSPSPDGFRNANASTWTITFDDGGISAATQIADQLENRNWRGWFFIATDFIGNPTFCSRQQIKELHDRGHVIGSHSSSHPERISNCTWEQLIDEWSRSRQVLEDLIGSEVTTASVPGGFYSKDVARAAADSGIRVLFNSEPSTSTTIVQEMLVVGRYNVYRGMSAGDAAALVKSPFRRWRQAAFWNVKKVAKVVAGPLYKSIRHQILSRDYHRQK